MEVCYQMQRIKRVLKKVGAISTGVAFLGATLTGALAADLNEYPAPFIVGGAYQDVAVITSSNGLDANAALLITNAFAGLITAEEGETGTTTVEGAYTLEKSGNKFNFNNDAYDLDSKLDKNDMDLLADQTFSDTKGTNKGDYEYTQEIKFSNNISATDRTLGLIYDENEDDTLGDYLYISKTGNFNTWMYVLDLTTTLPVENFADINNNIINMFGKDYTIVSSTVTSGNVTKLTLLSGDVKQTLKTGETVQGVTLKSVDTSGTKCTIEYDGTLFTITNGDTETMSDGTIIGVTDVVSTEAGVDDYCELNIGAFKVELQNNQKVKVNGDEIKDSKVNFGMGGLDIINISYVPQDKMYLAEGDEFVDPIFSAFKFMYEGLEETDVEEFKLSASGNDVTIDTTNRDGNRMYFDLCYTNSSAADLRFGSDRDEQLIVVEGDSVSNMTVADHTSTTNVEDLEGTKFLYSFNKYAHIVEITDIDTTTNKTDFTVIDDKDTDGTEYNDKDFTPNAVSTFDFMPNNFQLWISYNDAFIRFVDINDKGPSIFTKNEANITFMGNSSWGGIGFVANASLVAQGGQCYFEFQEVDTGKESDIPLNTLTVDFTYDTSGKEINLDTVTPLNNYAFASTSLKQIESGDTTTRGARTYYGTYIEKYVPTGTGEDTLLISYPDEAVYGKVYIAPLEAEATTTGATSTTYAPLEDSEVTDITDYNAIVVGGPAANMVAADLLGLTYPAYGTESGLSDGEAVIKLVDNGNKIAMIIYGWEQDDTKRAAKVFESYESFIADETLTGAEVSVTGTLASPTIVSETPAGNTS